jgi:hypothetical protein
VRPQAHLFDEVETPVRMAELAGDWIYRRRDRAIEEEHDEDQEWEEEDEDEEAGGDK